MVIREFTEADLPDLRACAAELHEALRPWDPELPPAPAIIDAYFRHLLAMARHTCGTFFIAETNGRLAGHLCIFGCVPPEPDEVSRPRALIVELYVRPDFRGQGIGRDLMAQAEAYARRLEVGRLELKVLAGNQRAVDFYHALGYSVRALEMTKPLGR